MPEIDTKPYMDLHDSGTNSLLLDDPEIIEFLVNNKKRRVSKSKVKPIMTKKQLFKRASCYYCNYNERLAAVEKEARNRHIKAMDEREQKERDVLTSSIFIGTPLARSSKLGIPGTFQFMDNNSGCTCLLSLKSGVLRRECVKCPDWKPKTRWHVKMGIAPVDTGDAELPLFHKKYPGKSG